MAEAKPTASLSSGLLARKGAARPAMRRHHHFLTATCGSTMIHDCPAILWPKETSTARVPPCTVVIISWQQFAK